MHTPARTLRAECDDLSDNRPAPCHREEERRTRILNAAQHLMANHGAAAIRLTDFALALRMAPLTIRRHFVDMDSILAAILHRHLMAIASALGQIPHGTANRAAAQRAAYLAFTRTQFGNPTEAHLLLIRDRHLLPPDLREPLEDHRAAIGDILAGPHAAATLALLDMPELAASQIEAALSAIAHPAKPPASYPQPLPRPAAPAKPTEAPHLPDLTAAKRPPMGPH